MIREFLEQRAIRKLRRDRMAMAALGVIAVYGLLAFLVLAFGLITKQEVFERVGPMNVPGFGFEQSHEKRLADARGFYDKVASAFAVDGTEELLRTLHYGPQGIVEAPLADHSRHLEHVRDLLDEMVAFDEIEGNEEAMAKVEEIEAQVAGFYEPLEGWEAVKQDFRLLLGTDRQGRSILLRALYSVKVAVQIGVVAALISVLIGTLLGGAAGYFGGLVDVLVVWLYSIFSSIPWIVMLMVLATMFHGDAFKSWVEAFPLIPVYAAFCLSFWISPCRVVRGEVMKLKELEYVQAASAIGFGRMRILMKHVIPNTAHLMFINFSLLFIGAIKAEVILSFLDLGVKNEPSWGVMISHAKSEVLNGFYWQIGAATVLMVVLVLAFNILSDALQDAFDPKHV